MPGVNCGAGFVRRRRGGCMTFGDRVVGALKLDANTFEDIERDPTAMGQAVAHHRALGTRQQSRPNLAAGLRGHAVRRLLVPGRLPALGGGRVARRHQADARPGNKSRLPGDVPDIAFAASPGAARRRTIVPLLGGVLMFLVDAGHLDLVDRGHGRRGAPGPRLLRDVQGGHRRAHRLRRLRRCSGCTWRSCRSAPRGRPIRG